MAIYALILNQMNKNEKITAPTDLRNIKTSPLKAGSSERFDVATYKYFDQNIFVMTSREDKRKMLVLEDGTSYEVIDSKDATPPKRSRQQFATASLSWR